MGLFYACYVKVSQFYSDIRKINLSATEDIAKIQMLLILKHFISLYSDPSLDLSLSLDLGLLS